MAKPVASAAALEVYEGLEALDSPLTEGAEANDWLSLRICIALTAGRLDLLHEYLIDDVNNLPAWGVLFDPQTAPEAALPYLSQFSGALLTPEMDEAARRAAIQTPEAFSRGRLASLEAVVKRRLTGTKSVQITERYTANAWRLLVETIEAETPEPEATEADILRYQKPIGIVLFFNSHPAWTWEELLAESVLYPDWEAVEAAFATWQELSSHEP